MSDRTSRLAIITGAASGLGRAFCRRLIAVSGNWHIVGVDTDAPALEQTLSELRQGNGVVAQCEPLDVVDARAWVVLRERLARDWPRIDLLVNSAGVCQSAEVGDGDLEAWRRVLDVNYVGVLNGCHTMTPWLKQSAMKPAMPSSNPVTPRSAAGSGLPPKPAIINIASIMGLVPAPALGAYSASKAAVIALSEAMYAELRPQGVNVTVAAPGFFQSSLFDQGAFAAQRHREQADELVRTSKIDADSVARDALRASARGELYAVMGRRARWFWRVKRMAPTMLLNSLSRRYQRMMRDDVHPQDDAD